jgi:hypothetical protein
VRVKLLKHVMEGNAVKCSVSRGGAVVVPFVAGAVVEVSEATGAKWIEKGLAEAIGEEAAENERPERDR